MNNISDWEQLSALDDIELVTAYRGGNLAAGEVIVSRYLSLVSARAATLMGGSASEFDCQDAIGEGIMGLFMAVRSYHSDKGASFKTYAYICISNRILNFRSGEFRRDSREELSIGELDEILLANANLDPQQIVLLRESENSLHEMLQTLLTKLEYEALLLFCSGMSYKEVADSLSVNAKSVDNAIGRCRRKLGSLSQRL